jgi:undecaprenyl diphosphate synthase
MTTVYSKMSTKMTLKRAEPLCDPKRIPHHVAIMMDGNRRWAKSRFLPSVAGHWKGAETLLKIVKAASEMGIKVLTLYSFSTENWNRTPEEIAGLLDLMSTYLRKERARMVQEGVKLETIGDLSPFPEELKTIIAETKQATHHCNKIELVLALNYGSRDEIRRAVIAAAEDLAQGKLSKENFTEETLASYLDTAKWSDPELIIRTGGEARLSNFLLWQISYSEIYITKTFWPDFSEDDLIEAIVDYQKRNRRLGG